MEEPFIGQVSIYGFAFAPRNWAYCNGATMQISQNAALYALLGFMYGGDNKTVFNLPDLRGRTMVGSGLAASGTPYTQGASGGQDSFTVPVKALPLHTHGFNARKAAAAQLSPAGGMFAQMPSNGNPPIAGLYTNTSSSQGNMAAGVIGGAGASAAAENRQPSLALNYCIATTGIWPSRQ